MRASSKSEALSEERLDVVPEPRFCFLAERQVGIGSAAGALERYLRSRSNVAWTDVTYVLLGGSLERLPFRKRVVGTMRGYLQTSNALRAGPFDALFFLTHNPAVLHQKHILQTPTLLWTDVTPALLDAQAEQYDHPVDEIWPVRALKRTMVRRTFHRAALCVAWSEWARRSFVTDYDVPESKTRVVPPGVDLSRWTLPAKNRPINGGDASNGAKPRLLFVGGDLERKGGDLLLDIYRRHFRKSCNLDIVTRDPVPEEEGVRVHRGVTAGSARLLELYRSASAFVLPTLGDCFSIATLEAMAMDLPVVVSSVGGIPEIIEGGQNGFLIKPGAGRELREALEVLTTDPARRRAMGARGRAMVEERFDAKKTADRLLELMAGIVGNGSAPPGMIA